MTNAEIITKIRLFANEQRNLLADFESNSNFRKGEITAYSAIIAFLSDLEKSLPSKVADREGLEEEINRYLREECSDDDEPGIHEIAEHFAEWGYLRAAEKYDELEYNRQRRERKKMFRKTLKKRRMVIEKRKLTTVIFSK